MQTLQDQSTAAQSCLIIRKLCNLCSLRSDFRCTHSSSALRSTTSHSGLINSDFKDRVWPHNQPSMWSWTYQTHTTVAWTRMHENKKLLKAGTWRSWHARAGLKGNNQELNGTCAMNVLGMISPASSVMRTVTITICSFMFENVKMDNTRDSQLEFWVKVKIDLPD